MVSGRVPRWSEIIAPLSARDFCPSEFHSLVHAIFAFGLRLMILDMIILIPDNFYLGPVWQKIEISVFVLLMSGIFLQQNHKIIYPMNQKL